MARNLGKCGLKDIGGIHGASWVSGANEGMDLIDKKENAAFSGSYLFDH